MPLPLLGWALVAAGAGALTLILSDSDKKSSPKDNVNTDKERKDFEKYKNNEGFNKAIEQLWGDYYMDQDITLDEQGFDLFMQSSKTGLDRLKDAFSLDELETVLRNELGARLADIEREQADLFELSKQYSIEGAK